MNYENMYGVQVRKMEAFKLYLIFLCFFFFRFENFNTEPLKSFEALNYKLVPKERSQLARYGNDGIKHLLHHFSAIFPEESHADILNEYANLKVYMRDFQSSDVPAKEVYTLLMKKPNLKNIQKLLELMMVISPSTAECERGFSAMNLIKSDVRNSLSQDSLRMLLTVKQHGPTFELFNPDRAIATWMGMGKGTRHIHGHSTPGSRQ